MGYQKGGLNRLYVFFSFFLKESVNDEGGKKRERKAKTERLIRERAGVKGEQTGNKEVVGWGFLFSS